MWFAHAFAQTPCTLGKMYWYNIIGCVSGTCTCVFCTVIRVFVCVCTIGCVSGTYTDGFHHLVKQEVYCNATGCILEGRNCMRCTYVLHQNQSILSVVLICDICCRQFKPEFQWYIDTRDEARVALSMFRTNVAPDFMSGDNLTTLSRVGSRMERVVRAIKRTGGDSKVRILYKYGMKMNLARGKNQRLIHPRDHLNHMKCYLDENKEDKAVRSRLLKEFMYGGSPLLDLVLVHTESSINHPVDIEGLEILSGSGQWRWVLWTRWRSEP